jgi:hypothetical protein
MKFLKYFPFGELTIALVEESSNRKLQVYNSKLKVLTAYIIPTHLQKSEFATWQMYEDVVCAQNCKHTKRNGGTCYVGGIQYSVWKVIEAFHTNPEKTFKLPEAYGIRATAHGDLCRLNADGKLFMKILMEGAQEVRAYTAGWLQQDMIDMFQNCGVMASVYNSADALLAQGLGWRTYRYRESDNVRAHDGERNCTLLGNGHPSEDGRGCFAACPSPCNGTAFNVVSPDHEKLKRQQKRLDNIQVSL